MATKKFVAPQLVELRAAIQEAEQITAKPEVTKRDELRFNFLLAKIAGLRNQAVNPTRGYSEPCKAWFRDFVAGREVRATDLFEGKNTPTYTQGSAGGYLVPQEFYDDVIYGMAQVDPLLDEDVVTLIPSKGLALRPMPIPGWDLSTFKAVRVAEGAQQNPQTIPTVAGLNLGSYTYKATLDASFELEEDAADTFIDGLQRAFAVAFARGIGIDLVTGTGSAQPGGILTDAANSSVTTTVGQIKYTDIENIYFSVNRIYRASDKCAWLMSDKQYQEIRTAVDDQHRPLLNILKDKELLMGKPVLISPTVPDTTSGHKSIIFGDLSHYIVRASELRLTRTIQAAGYVDKGKGLYTGIMRADAGILDPTGGNTPPIVYATHG